MTAHNFTFATVPLRALASGALHWPAYNLLVVSDLHMGKSERLARRGGSLLPPYDTRATLDRLLADLTTTAATQVICLGDSFDDLTAAQALEPQDRLVLQRMMQGRTWTWIIGNHDAGPHDLGGSHLAEVTLGPLTFRHIASQDWPEISGHYHPKAQLAGRSRPCFLIDANRVILPAYGTYTGGLPCTDPILCDLMGPDARAVLTGNLALAIPMPR